jgi:NAD(P)-dependent dehydrogenase (short-subunit alcohol dehydrogenase family)
MISRLTGNIRAGDGKMRPFLTGRVVLVTGASKGFGAGTARVMARAGAAVIATARDQHALSDVVDEIRAEGAQGVAISADLTEDAQVADLVRQAVRIAGRIDMLINIAGSAEAIGTKVWETPPEAWRRLCRTNLTGVLNLLRHIVPVMQAHYHGRLLFLSSPATFRPQPETGAYAATKAGVNQIVQTLALELRGTGITANTFNPGPIDTPLYGEISGVLNRNAQPSIPVQGRPPELAAQLLLWLCAEETRDLTGEFIQWDNPNTLAAMEEFRQVHRIGRVD